MIVEEETQEDEEVEIERRTRTLEERFKRLNILGIEGVEVEGDVYKGYAINTSRFFGSGAGGITTGACCIGGVCSTKNRTQCENSSGTYLGDGTLCIPDPCGGGGGGGIGACCQGSTCTNTTADNCAGTFHLGIACFSGFCASFLPPCNGCGFTEFVSPSSPPRKFLARLVITTGSSFADANGCSSTFSAARLDEIFPPNCVPVCNCSATGNLDSDHPEIHCSVHSVGCQGSFTILGPLDLLSSGSSGCSLACLGGIIQCANVIGSSTLYFRTQTEVSAHLDYAPGPGAGGTIDYGAILVAESECNPNA